MQKVRLSPSSTRFLTFCFGFSGKFDFCVYFT